MYEILYLFLAGLLGGFLAGFTGVGGGIIYIMVLPYVLVNKGIDEDSLAAVIVANSIFGIFFASLVSVITHARLKTIYMKESFMVSVPAVFISLLVLAFFVNTPRYSYSIFNLFIIVLMACVLLLYLFNKKKEVSESKKESLLKYIVSGGISGLISSLGGVGGAITFIPLMQHWQIISIKKAKSLSLFMILMMTGSMSIYNLLQPKFNDEFVGLISFRIITPMLLGIVLMSWLGVRVAHRSTPKIIEYIFLFFTLIVLINKMYLLLAG